MSSYNITGVKILFLLRYSRIKGHVDDIFVGVRGVGLGKRRYDG